MKVTKVMGERGRGRIINVCSVDRSKGLLARATVLPPKPAYGHTKAMALEVARKGVAVKTIEPGCIGTKMVTAERNRKLLAY